jgi:hypothetical protein
MQDFFEIERLIEDFAKLYSTACATSWYKILNRGYPSDQEFREKVAEFMKHFEYTLSFFPDNERGNIFKIYAHNLLEKEINSVLTGNNKEVEKRYKYFLSYK